MRLGLLARADNTGLGHQSRELHHRLLPAKTLIVDLHGLSASGKDLTAHPDRFPHGQVDTVHGIPGDLLLDGWLDGLDTVLTLETPYNHNLYGLARRRGVKSVLQGNWELLDYLHPGPHHDHPPDVLALPSTWHLDEARHLLGDHMAVVHLPLPAPDPYPARRKSLTATRWLHPAGYPALADRNGTRSLLACLKYIQSTITVSLTCQRPGFLGGLIQPGVSPPNVTLVIETDSPQDWHDLYTGHDAVVLPRRYGGLCLPVNESLAGGLPVIMTDIEPNRSWLPPGWLVPARHHNTVMTKTLTEVYDADPRSLAAKIDEWSTDTQSYTEAVSHTHSTRDKISWEHLQDHYRRALAPR